MKDPIESSIVIYSDRHCCYPRGHFKIMTGLLSLPSELLQEIGGQVSSVSSLTSRLPAAILTLILLVDGRQHSTLSMQTD